MDSASVCLRWSKGPGILFRLSLRDERQVHEPLDALVTL